jgi:hypothetical protein
MKKIIAAFDGLKYSSATSHYAVNLAKQTHTHLVGVFMDDPTNTSYKIYELITNEGVSGEKLKQMEDADIATRKIASVKFEKACQEEGLEYTIHHDRNFALQEVKHESIYADLLIIDSSETLTHYPENLPTRFIRNLLNDVQCPVLLVPQKYNPIQKIILLYDGEPSAVHAVKMFSYILPQLKHLETDVITVNPVATSLHLPDSKLMKEFMKRHYPKANYIVMQGLAEIEIVNYLKKIPQNALVVLGAYKRGTVSRWFRESMADLLMREITLPLFIAHNK